MYLVILESNEKRLNLEPDDIGSEYYGFDDILSNDLSVVFMDVKYVSDWGPVLVRSFMPPINTHVFHVDRSGLTYSHLNFLGHNDAQQQG